MRTRCLYERTSANQPQSGRRQQALERLHHQPYDHDDHPQGFLSLQTRHQRRSRRDDHRMLVQSQTNLRIPCTMPICKSECDGSERKDLRSNRRRKHNRPSPRRLHGGQQIRVQAPSQMVRGVDGSHNMLSQLAGLAKRLWRQWRGISSA